MDHFTPTTMAEIQQKLAWYKTQGQVKTEDDVICEAVLENARISLNDALEGPYWSAEWQKLDREIVILDGLDVAQGTLTPTQATFSADFRKNAIRLLQALDARIQIIIGR